MIWHRRRFHVKEGVIPLIDIVGIEGEVKMYRAKLVIVLFGCLVLLASCQTDDKTATKIQEKMKKSAVYEADFHENQEDLEKYREKEEETYEGLIDSDIQNQEDIASKTEEGKEDLKQQQHLLKEGKENFQQAYDEAYAIQDRVNNIQDKEQQEQASGILDILEERNDEIKDYFDIYHKQVNLLDDFYEEIETEDIPIDKMEGKIDEINDNTEDIEKHIHAFNEATDAYNQQESTYYETVEKSS